MKKILFLAASLLFIHSIRAQTFDEWFRQGRTAKKYLREQVKALSVFLDVTRKGYNIAREGLTIIAAIKNADFNLHDDYFKSLESSNSFIQNWSKLKELLSLQFHLYQGIATTKKVIATTKALTASETVYLRNILDHLFLETMGNAEDLAMLVDAGQAVMTDDERIHHIDNLGNSLLADYIFFKSICRQLATLVLRRAKDAAEIDRSRKIRGL